MAYVDTNHSGNAHVEPKISENMFDEENQIANGILDSQSDLKPFYGKYIPTDELLNEKKITGIETLDKGYFEYGCSHYRRRCRIRAPCCNEIFYCRHCHNEAKNHIGIDPKLRHDVPRHLIGMVICSLCGTEQEVQQVCTNCGVCMGRYFCRVCKLFDDDISKEQYHCDGCGICRTGGSENVFHCDKCATIRAWRKQCTKTVLFVLSIYLTREMMLLLSDVGIPFTKCAWKRCSNTINMLARSVPSQFVICQKYGRNWIRKLQLLLCPQIVRARWYG